MNIALTQAAEGLRRRAFTVAEVERMVETGLLRPDERLELIGGKLVPLSPKGLRHEIVRRALLRQWNRILPTGLDIFPETTLRLSADTYIEPDILVLPSSVPTSRIVASAVLLAVEIADSSLGYDLGQKAAVCAAHGVRELWVIDAERLTTHVHRDPTPLGYRDIVPHSASADLLPRLVPALPLRLSALDLGE